MTIETAYEPDGLIVPGVLPPAYGRGWAIPGQLQPAYGNDALIFNDPSIAFDSRITFTASTTRNRYGSSGVLTSTAIDTPRANQRQDYNPSTLAARGFLIEAGATNAIRNNTMVGAVAGTPGTPPTNWEVDGSSSGITRQVVGVGTENGIDYIDIKYSGTAAGLTSRSIGAELVNGVAASSGQTWCGSFYVKLVAGSLSNVTLTINLLETNGVGGVVNNVSPAIVPTGSALSAQRFTYAVALSGGGTVTNLQPKIRVAFPNLSTIDVTLRIGLPQLEQNAFATSVVKTSTAAVARGADNASITTLSSIGFSSTRGFVVCRFMLNGVGSNGARRVISFDDGTTTNRMALIVSDNAGDEVGFLVTTGGVQQGVITGPALASLTLCKAAIGWGPNGFKMAVNGTGYTAFTGTVPTVTQLAIGRAGNNSNWLNGWVQDMQYGPQELTQAQLNAASTQ